MLTVKSSDYIGNPFLLDQIPRHRAGAAQCLAGASLACLAAHRVARSDAVRNNAAGAGAALSLIFWLTAITAGRMIGYW